ncbi:unnamed protein product [Bursaphelenchus okinawaensis]|uniref:Kringle domain-containing protein n=1 Tax=Bursaphelenchus okinawaensis TaxID=465554 RepID=A0A811JW03_9BILA|nr:unnamed protein product [Bursaphelenchus okinawaensis]CAG9085134.1 unnamed protein product [Bursaphelenchus okinawaensis]
MGIMKALLISIVLITVERVVGLEDRDWDEATGEQIFPSGAVELNEQKFLRLEDFYNKTKTIPQTTLQRLIIDVSMVQWDTDDVEHFYEVCAQNLKRTAPNLKMVALEGGYQYYPEEPDHETIPIELEDVKAGVQLVIRAARSAGIEITSVVLAVSLFVPFPLVQDSNYPSLFKKIYNKTVTDYDLERNVVECLFTVDGVPIDAEFTFYNDRVFDKVNKGRHPLVRNRQSREKAFNPASEVRSRYFFTLEKFFNDKLKAMYALNENIDDIYYLLVTLIHDQAIKPDYFYRHAVQHLKEAAPMLKTLELWGGAAVHLKHGKQLELDMELRNLKQNLESMLRAFKNVGIRIKKLDYEAYMNFEEEFVVSAAYPKLVQQLFGHVVSQREIDMEIVDMEVKIFDVTCHIKLNFFFEPSIMNLQQERMGKTWFNFSDADCILKEDQEHYVYYGLHNKSAQGIPCAQWSEARQHILGITGDVEQYFFAQENEDHNFCRSLNLNAYSPTEGINNAPGHVFMDYPDAKMGPWCYVKYKKYKRPAWIGQFEFLVEPKACFQYCKGQPVNATEVKQIVEVATDKPHKFYHYNLDLIENLTDIIFDSYDFGDVEKYLNPDIENKEKRKSEFETNRDNMLYIGNAILVTLFVLLLLKRFFKKKDSDVQKEESEISSQVEETPKATSPTKEVKKDVASNVNDSVIQDPNVSNVSTQPPDANFNPAAPPDPAQPPVTPPSSIQPAAPNPSVL